MLYRHLNLRLLSRKYACLGVFFLALCSTSLHAQTAHMPPWFSQPSAGLRAATVVRATGITDSLLLAKALKQAVQSLNANREIWFLAEHFKEVSSTYHSFHEFAIDEHYTLADLKISQQQKVGDWFFVQLEPKEATLCTNALSSASRQENTQWLTAEASYPLLFTNPHRSFEKAKQEAIKQLAYQTQMKVGGTSWETAGFSGDLFFIKSRVHLQCIDVVQRRVKNGRCIVQVKVAKERVQAY